MESRKEQLKNQIIEALKFNDNDLYLLLKSQWAHRFGVESLEELKSLDLNPVIENLNKETNPGNQQSHDYSLDNDQVNLPKDNNNFLYNQGLDKSIENSPKDQFESKSYEIFQEEKSENKNFDSVPIKKSLPQVQALIPIPPKPKYGYFKKWIKINTRN